MPFTTAGASLLRRRLAVAFVLSAILIGAVVGGRLVQQQYSSEGVVLVIPPGAGSSVPGDNPFGRLDTTDQLANVIAAVATSAAGTAAVVGAGAAPDFTVEHVAGDNAMSYQLSAEIRIEVHGSSEWTARAGAFALIDVMRSAVGSVQAQAGLPENTLVDLRVTVEPRPGELVAGSVVRARIGGAGVGGLGALIVLVTLAARRRRSDDRSARASTPTPTPTTIAVSAT